MNSNKHVNLFKQIPFEKFYAGKEFFDQAISLQNKNVKDEIILRCYYYISEEMYDPHATFIIKDVLSSYDFHDNITKTHEILLKRRYKKPKKFNGVLNQFGVNRIPHTPYGLTVKPKPGIPKKDANRLIEDFCIYALLYQPRRDIFTRETEQVSSDKIDYLYQLLQELLDKTDLSYITKGSIVLAKEMAEDLSHQSIVKYALNQIKSGHDRDETEQLLERHKTLMFPGLKHDWDHYRAVKHNLKKQQQNKR